MFNKKTFDIVKFEDGFYGYRRATKWLIFTNYEFLDNGSRHWHSENIQVRTNCKFQNYESVTSAVDRMNKIESYKKTDIGVPVKNDD